MQITDEELIKVKNFKQELISLWTQIGKNTIEIADFELKLTEIKSYQTDLINTYHSVYNQYAEFGDSLGEKYQSDKIDADTGQIN